MEVESDSPGTKPRRKWLWIACFALAIPAVVTVLGAVGLVGVSLYSDWSHRMDFDAELWRASEDDGGMWPPRLCMVGDLISSRRLIGLRPDEVTQLLGPPASPGFPSGARGTALHYELGPERGFIRLDSAWLFIGTGADGAVDSAWLYTD